ncbi:hypothetical protein TCSYLVIO_007774 [Trypanosoma cruzi]|nr:hypothetical protein TCSYLVIO_007774 [Trypanosoma cruzi]
MIPTHHVDCWSTGSAANIYHKNNSFFLAVVHIQRTPLAAGHTTHKKEHNALRSCEGYRPTTTTQIRMILQFATTPLKWPGVFSCCSTALATTRAIWPHRMIALHRCQRQPNPQRPIPARLHHHTGLFQKRILVRRGVARRGTRAPSALRRRRAVLLHTPGPPRHMLKVRRQMGFGRQSTPSEQLLLLGLRQLVVAARSNKQQEKKQSHWPGHRGIPRQVPHAIQVFPEEFCAQRRCLVPPPAPPPVASPSTVPQASRKKSICSDSLACLSRNFSKARTALLNLTRLALGSTPCANPG